MSSVFYPTGYGFGNWMFYPINSLRNHTNSWKVLQLAVTDQTDEGSEIDEGFHNKSDKGVSSSTSVFSRAMNERRASVDVR